MFKAYFNRAGEMDHVDNYDHLVDAVNDLLQHWWEEESPDNSAVLYNAAGVPVAVIVTIEKRVECKGVVRVSYTSSGASSLYRVTYVLKDGSYDHTEVVQL